MIRHVVLLKMSDPADVVECKARLEALAPSIPEVLSLEVGIDVVREAASYDLFLITTHDTVEGLHAYAAHPAHQEFLAWVRPRLAARVVVDAEVS